MDVQNMTWIDIAALIGAAAWLPQIVTWVYRAAVKPKLDIVPAPTPEVGYTFYGPIFNVMLAFSAARKDAIIDQIQLTISHEKGRRISLTWVSLNEAFSQIRGPAGETSEISKNQAAIALKIGTVALAEKLVGFQDLEFLTGARERLNSLMEHQAHLGKTTDEPNKETLKSKQFAEWRDYYERHFCWEVGSYNVNAQLHLLGVKKTTTRTWQFRLSALDVDRLKKNLDEVSRCLTEMIDPPDPEDRRDYSWTWINPTLEDQRQG